MKRKNNITLLFAVIIIFKVNSQNLPMLKDTFYFLTLVSSLDNGRPVTNIALLKSLNTLKEIKKDNQNRFICDFYKEAIISEDPMLGFNKILSYSTDSSEFRLKELGEGVAKMAKCDKKVNLHFTNGKSITMYMNKIVAYFWEIPMSNKSIISHSFEPLCYNKDYYLTLKKVTKCLKIKKSEIKQLEKDWR